MCAFCSSTILEAWNGAFHVSTRAKVTKEPSFQAFLGTEAMIPLQVLVICSHPVTKSFQLHFTRGQRKALNFVQECGRNIKNYAGTN